MKKMYHGLHNDTMGQRMVQNSFIDNNSNSVNCSYFIGYMNDYKLRRNQVYPQNIIAVHNLGLSQFKVARNVRLYPWLLLVSNVVKCACSTV